MTLFASGNLAIGPTTDSGFKLDVNGTGRFSITTTGNTLTLFTSFASGRAVNFGFGNGIVLPNAAFYIGNQTAVGVFIGDETTTNGLYVKANGDVGIGTTDPQSKFDVTNIVGTAYDASNTLVSGQTMRIANTSGVVGISANLLFIATGGGGGNGLGSISGVNTGTGSMALTFGTRDSGGSVTEKMRITSGGNVLINTTSDNGTGAKLQVAGDLSTEGSVRIGNSVQYTRVAANGDITTSITFASTNGFWANNAVEILVSRANNLAPSGISKILVSMNQLNSSLSTVSTTTLASLGTGVSISTSVSGATITITLQTHTDSASRSVAHFNVISYYGITVS